MLPTRRTLEPIDSDEIKRLLTAYARTGDLNERDRAITLALPLADCLARRYRRSGVDLEDLQQVAYLGLVRATDRYDPDFPNGFVPFAVVTIIGELRRFFRDRTWSVRVPRSIKERGLVVRAATERVAASGRRPTLANVAHEAALSTEETLEALEGYEARRAASLDAPVGVDGSSTLGDFVAPTPDGSERVIDLLALRSIIEGLPEEDRNLIDLRFGADLTQREIGDMLGCSQMHVSRRLSRLQASLRARMATT